MISVSDLRIWLKLSLVLCVLVSAFMTFVSRVEGQSKEQVTLKVKVSVINQTGDSIKGAKIVIVRQGMKNNDGEELDNIIGLTDKNGSWLAPKRDYPQKDMPYSLQISAPGYKDLNNDKDLSFQNLKAAFDQGINYSLTLPMTKEVEGDGGKVAGSRAGVNSAGDPNVGGSAGGNGNGDPTGGDAGTGQGAGGKGSGGAQFSDGSFMATLGSGIGTGLRWLAWLSLALTLAALLAYIFFGMRISFHRVGESTWRQEIGALITNLSKLEEKVAETILAQGITNHSLEEMTSTLTAIKDAQPKTISLPPPPNQSTKPLAGDIEAQNRTHQRMIAPTLPQDEARAAYRNLVTGNASGQEFIYLSDEGGSPLGMFGDKYVNLVEGSTQGAFVLFTVDGEMGWVFPNPSLRFRQSALRPVFPQLTEDMFEINKENLPPRQASNIGKGRWRVEHEKV